VTVSIVFIYGVCSDDDDDEGMCSFSFTQRLWLESLSFEICVNLLNE
jgi:hypothetical protein